MLRFHSIRKGGVTYYVRNTVFATFWDTIVCPTELGALCVLGHGYETALCAGYAAILITVAASASRAFCSALI